MKGNRVYAIVKSFETANHSKETSNNNAPCT